MKNFKSLNFFVLIAIVFAIHNSTAQTDKISFKEYGVEEGLPEEVAIQFIQDKEGYIWIGTQNGLAKFDGYNMKVYRSDLEDKNGLHLRNLIGGLLQADNGLIWIGGISRSGGLASFDPKTDKFTNYLVDENDDTKVPYQSCYILFEDVQNHIWFASYGSNQKTFLCKIDPVTKKVNRYPYRVSSRSNDIVLNYMMAESEKDSSIWLRSREYDMLRLDRSTNTFEIQFKNGDIIPGTAQKDSIIDLNYAPINELLTMTNNNRLYLFDPISKEVKKTYEFKNRDSIAYGATFEDHNGNLWVSSHDNISIINPKTDDIKHFKLGEDELDFGMNLSILQIQPRAQNNDLILFSLIEFDGRISNEAHTLAYDLKSKQFKYYDYRFNDKNNTIKSYSGSRNFMFDKSGLIWLGTRPNLYKQAPKSSQITQYNYKPNIRNSLPSDSVTSLFEDSSGRLWMATIKDLVLKNDDDTFTAYPWTSKKEGKLNDGFIIKIIEDDDGDFWLASSQGLIQFSLETKSFKTFLPITSPLHMVMEMMLEPNDQLWVSIIGKGVYVVDTKTGDIVKSFDAIDEQSHKLTGRYIGRIYKDSKDEIWLGDFTNTQNAAFKYDPSSNTFKHYNRDPKDPYSLINNEIEFFIEDDLDRLWVGTDGGICLYDRENDRFLQNTDNINIPSVSEAVKAKNGKLWVTTYSGGGLVRVGPGINDVELYGEESGLLHNDINNISYDNLGKLWLPNLRGLSVFDTLTKTYTSFYEKDGYQQYESFNPILKTSTGNIYIGGENGLNFINPSRLTQVDSTVPIVQITKMTIMDSIYSNPDGDLFKQSVSFTDQLTLEYWQKDLSFNFVGIHYLRPEDNLYSYKLENYDKEWSIPSKERHAAYTNLSPGTYIFKVKASNADGIWNDEPAELKVIIAPPWWQSWWAYVVYSLIAILIIYWIHKTQKERTLRKERERAQQKELEQAKEIEIAYENLKTTQAKLIQSEKMASLGELTAGIAHEIQNPLNFVNNFSEVSAELLDELKDELEEGDLEEVKLLLVDIKENLEKINHHGKRADGIVKGMLQHSRDNSGEKEKIDINQLADEYLRLAYHGFRAKDKSFNSQLETDFQKSLKKVKVVPQDIGRVILNLITNAFHAVTEKKHLLNGSQDSDYKPTVWVKTFESNGNVVVEVKDNGNGIPEHVKHKIFQPFFTTKPAGQGTGLGLSLSYDIVKAHNGDIEISSEEGMGTTFSVSLPKQNFK